MSRLRPTVEEQKNRELVARIMYGKKLAGLNHHQLALSAGICDRALSVRFNHPEKFRLCELRGISSKIHIPVLKLLGNEPIV